MKSLAAEQTEKLLVSISSPTKGTARLIEVLLVFITDYFHLFGFKIGFYSLCYGTCWRRCYIRLHLCINEPQWDSTRDVGRLREAKKASLLGRGLTL